VEKYTFRTGVAASLIRPNIDTDAIIPSREMKRVSKRGLGEGLFAGWRYREVGSRDLNPDFVLNKPAFAGAGILLSGANFGCGSSREHAVWALEEYGIHTIIAPSFGAIFANNCIRNGLLPLVLDETAIAEIAAWVELAPQQNAVTIDLPAQQVRAGTLQYDFSIDSGAKHMLVEGLDAIALTQTCQDEILAFHDRRRVNRPWLY
jgi:3-isopropylmalate/(R)-2-methylmalate dehydratase small subunit